MGSNVASMKSNYAALGQKSTMTRRLDLITVGSAIIVGILTSLTPAQAWGGNDETSNMYAYGNSFSQDYIYDSKSISLKLGGCVYSPISGRAGGDKDGDYGNGCMGDESEDGTSVWYQMSNCMRANAAFSFYSSDSSNKASCSSGTFQESLITTNGLSEFVYYLQQYDANSPFGNNRRLDDYGYDNIPSCEQGDDGYIGVGCGDDGSFVLEYFDDQYCLERSGKVYDYMKNLNKSLKQYKSCSVVYQDGDNSNFAQAILPYTESCSSLDSSMCSDDSVMASRIGNANSFATKSTGIFKSASVKSWGTKLKYGLGCLLLFASFIMFTGILFTNRRRRRALMQRKFRQSSDKSRKSSRSKSRRGDRDEKSRRSSRSKRSKSRSKRAEAESGGVYT
uniref:Uncharacterized protein n=2 Tax=Asterionellopsis glacialis TaxID=33640 RepID=A0A7S0PWC7_9STRA|mmetsp:Transcript_1364/g.1909  ORF Transcript_1364/g.1909 Transcript_1364/m.1909 type:complete len:393 (+) Transcript_1364:177-1355(+)